MQLTYIDTGTTVMVEYAIDVAPLEGKLMEMTNIGVTLLWDKTWTFIPWTSILAMTLQ